MNDLRLRKPDRAMVAGMLGVALAIAATGCGAGSEPSSSQPTPGAYAYRDPGQVCARFAADRFAHDATVDSGPETAHQRAQVWLHPDLHREQRPGRHPQWATWRAHRAAVEVSVEPWAGDALPPDTDETAYRAVLIAATPIGADGWIGPTDRYAVMCALSASGDGWLISGYHIDGGE